MKVIGRGEHKMTPVRFNRWEDKKEIMTKRKKIGKARKIFMDDDLTATERQIQKHLWSILKAREKKGRKQRGLRICFWNVAGLINKCEEAWDYLENFDVIGLQIYLELCTSEKGTQESKSKRGIITAVNKNLKLIEVREISDEMVESRLEYNGNKWRIITLYSRKMEDTTETLREKVQEEDEQWMLVGDYVVGNDRAKEEINMVEEGIRTESDHVPLEVELTGLRMIKTGRRKKEIKIERSDWTEGGRREYHEKCEGWSRHLEGDERKVKSAITKRKKKIIPWRLGRKEWYNKEWKERKRRLRRLMRDWKKGRIGKEEYVRERKEHKEWCKEQNGRHKIEEEEKIRNIKNEAEAWKYINKYRKKKAEGISEQIHMDEWRDHFMEMLGGTEERV
ncbi:hypothetical protein DBV15_11466, partial [Temnothorax longispinosus]